MTAGIEIFGESGKTIIVDSFPTYGLRTSGNAAVAGNKIGGLYYKSEISITATDPILSIQPIQNDIIAYASIQKLSATSFKVHFFSEEHCNILYWIYDKPYVQTDPYGLAVFDGSGNLTFSSQQKPLIIIGDAHLVNFTGYNSESLLTSSLTVSVMVSSHAPHVYPAGISGQPQIHGFQLGGIVKKTSGLYGKQLRVGTYDYYGGIIVSHDIRRYNLVRIP